MGSCLSPCAAELEIARQYIELDGWGIIALVDGGPNGAQTEALVLMRLGPAPVPGANISAVLAERTATGWSASAWVDDDPNAVAWWLSQTFALPAPTDEGEPWLFPYIDPEVALTVAPAEAPEPFGEGVLLASPWSALVAALAEPLPVVAALEELGQPAAASAGTVSGPIGEPGVGPIDECGGLHIISPEQVWSAIAAGIDAEIAEPGTGDQAMDDFLAIACCWKRTVVRRTNPPWTCATGPFPGGGGAVCSYNGCTRTVIETRTTINWDCTVTGPTSVTTVETKDPLDCPGGAGVPCPSTPSCR